MTTKPARALGVHVEYALEFDGKVEWFRDSKERDAKTQDAINHAESIDTIRRFERWSWPQEDEVVLVLPEKDLLGYHDEPHFIRIQGGNNETELHSESYLNRSKARTAALRYFRRQAAAADRMRG